MNEEKEEIPIEEPVNKAGFFFPGLFAGAVVKSKRVTENTD